MLIGPRPHAADRIVRRPIAVTMAVGAAVLLGIIGAPGLPIELLPALRQSRLQVITRHPGASASEVDRAVTQPLDRSLRALASAEHVGSVSRHGIAVIDIRFLPGTDSDVALLATREAVDRVRPALPALAGRPLIVTAAAPPLLAIAVGSRDTAPLPKVIALAIQHRLEQVNGVAAVAVDGATDTQIGIEVNSAALEAFSLTPAHIAAVIHDASVEPGGGTLRHGRERIPIRTAAAIANSADIAALPLAIERPAPWVTVGDVARVGERTRTREGVTRLDGLPAVVLTVHAEPEANALTVSRQIDTSLAALARDFPGVRIAIAEDRAKALSLILGSVVWSAAIGGTLAVLFLFVILPDWRHAAIVGVAVPASLGVTLLLLRMTGTSLNLMSVGGLALGAGMLTDAAIVMVASIAHWRSRGIRAIDAAALGLRDSAAPLIGSTLTTIAVFAPALMIRDVAGSLLRDVALAVACALGASAAVSLLLVPVMAGWWGTRTTRRRACPPQYRRVIDASFARWVRLHHCLVTAGRTHPRAFVMLLIVLPALVTGLVWGLPRSLLPNVDTGYVLVRLGMSADAPFDELSARSRQLERLLATDSDVALVLARVGLDISSTREGPGRVNESSLLLRLRRGSRDSMVIARAQALLEKEAGIVAEVRQGSAGSIPRLLAAERADVIAEFRGESGVVGEHAKRVAREMRSRREFVNVQAGFADMVRELRVVLDRERSAVLGIGRSEVVGAASLSTQGVRVGAIAVQDGEVPIVMWTGHQAGGTTTLDDMRVRGVPVRLLGRVERGQVAAELQRSNGVLVSNVTADIAPGARHAAHSYLRDARASLPPGVSVTVRGSDLAVRRSLVALVAALGIALLMVYAILAIEFDSLLEPLIVLLSVPIGMSGAIVALWLAGAGLNAMSLIGLVMLAGIADNDAVVKLDGLHRARAEGLDLNGALASAAESRLRPIAINSMTATVGALPIALGLGAGASLQAPLAIALVGGLATSTLLAPVAVSTLYALIDERHSGRRPGPTQWNDW